MENNLDTSDSGTLIATFLLDNALFGIDANQIQEVVQLKKLTLVYNAPLYVKGVMNLRGRVVTVIDLGEKLDLKPVSENDENRVLIVEWKQEYIGILVEGVNEVFQVEKATIKPAPRNVNGIQAEFIIGVFKNRDGVVAGLLDFNKILHIEESQKNCME